MSPVAIALTSTPAHAIALYPDGMVRISGVACVKGTHVASALFTPLSILSATPANFTTTPFAGRCDPDLLPSAESLAAAVALIATAPMAARITMGASIDGYEETWACPVDEIPQPDPLPDDVPPDPPGV